eukprot:7683834-Alexandrium_andersonii.AAC.1
MTQEQHALIEVLRANGEGGQLLAVRVEFGGRSVLAVNAYVRDPANPWAAYKLNEAIMGPGLATSLWQAISIAE